MASDRFNLTRQQTLQLAEKIAEEYRDQDLVLTLRQLYYQFVARGHETNGQHVYKRLGEVLSDARLTGDFPMDLLEDRGRDVGGSAYEIQLDVAEASQNIQDEVRRGPTQWLWAQPWIAQTTVPYVWIEKDALAGVFQKPCKDMGVGLFACRGYPSHQALWQFLSHVRGMREIQQGYSARRLWNTVFRREGHDTAGYDSPSDHRTWARRVVVLYFGDHDPDGLEIPESAERNIRLLMENHNGDGDFDDMPELAFRRVALTRTQIETYNPPPFPAKETSARFNSYVNRTGLYEAWELDALDPKTLRETVRREIARYFNRATWDAVQALVKTRRSELTEEMRKPSWLAEALQAGNDNTDDNDDE